MRAIRKILAVGFLVVGMVFLSFPLCSAQQQDDRNYTSIYLFHGQGGGASGGISQAGVSGGGSVPEPGTLLLLSSGLGGLIIFKRIRKNSSRK